LISPIEPVPIWALVSSTRNGHQLMTMQVLQAVTKHRTVDFCEQIRSNVNLGVWRNAQNPCIEGCMVNLAECQSISYDRLPTVNPIWDNVSRIQQLTVPQ
jgi:hypothetical protein